MLYNENSFKRPAQSCFLSNDSNHQPVISTPWSELCLLSTEICFKSFNHQCSFHLCRYLSSSTFWASVCDILPDGDDSSASLSRACPDKETVEGRLHLRVQYLHARSFWHSLLLEDYCYFFLHEPCALAELPQQITKHPVHPKHPLLMMKSQMYCCHLCQMDLKASVVIASLPPLEEENKIQHVAHEHPLTAFHTRAPNWIRCEGCQERMSGQPYGCHSCQFFLHESCARLRKERLQYPFYP